jgi:serine phosphatase RsbU (regulator of sigma subunit)
MEMDKWLTLSLLDYHDGELTLIGQHEEILWVRHDKKVERIDTFDLGFMIGLEEDIHRFVNSKKIHLESGEGIVLYTDGLTEARNTEKQQYGVDRLCSLVHKYWDESPEQIKNLIVADLEQHIGNCQLSDDVTLLIIRKK